MRDIRKYVESLNELEENKDSATHFNEVFSSSWSLLKKFGFREIPLMGNIYLELKQIPKEGMLELEFHRDIGIKQIGIKLSDRYCNLERGFLLEVRQNAFSLNYWRNYFSGKAKLSKLLDFEPRPLEIYTE